MELALRFPVFSWPTFGRFHRRLVLPLFLIVLCMAVILSGCSFASFVAAAEADVPVVITMITNITQFVAPIVSPAIGTAGSLTLAALVLLCGNPAPGAATCDPSSLIGQYQASNSTNASILAKIQAALETVNSHINDMLNLAKGLPSNIGAAIVTAVGVALATVTSLMSLVGLKAQLRTAAPTKSLLKTIPKPAAIKAQFNAAIGGLYPMAMVH